MLLSLISNFFCFQVEKTNPMPKTYVCLLNCFQITKLCIMTQTPFYFMSCVNMTNMGKNELRRVAIFFRKSCKYTPFLTKSLTFHTSMQSKENHCTIHTVYFQGFKFCAGNFEVIEATQMKSMSQNLRFFSLNIDFTSMYLFSSYQPSYNFQYFLDKTFDENPNYR